MNDIAGDRTGRATRTSVTLGLAALLVVAGFASCGEKVETAPNVDALAQNELNQKLIDAAWSNDVEVATELIDAGADVNYQDSTQQSAYLISTSEGHVELLNLTLEHGADVASLDSFNGTGLIRAAERGHFNVVERLLGTDIDVNHINRLGWTALHEAIILGDGSDKYVRTVRLLLANGADPSLVSQSDNSSPLQHAENRQQEEIAQLLRLAIQEG